MEKTLSFPSSCCPSYSCEVKFASVRFLTIGSFISEITKSSKKTMFYMYSTLIHDRLKVLPLKFQYLSLVGGICLSVHPFV